MLDKIDLNDIEKIALDAGNTIMEIYNRDFSIEYKDEESDLNEIFSDISIEVIEIIKKQVQIQKWKLKEKAEQGHYRIKGKNVTYATVIFKRVFYYRK